LSAYLKEENIKIVNRSLISENVFGLLIRQPNNNTINNKLSFNNIGCEACEAFEPQFSDLVKDFQPYVDQLVFGRVSCRTEADYLCRQYSIDTLPTLILIDE
jgi:hypothetical protein